MKSDSTVRFGAAPSDRVAYRVWGKVDYSTPAFSSPGYYMLDATFPYRGPQVDNLDRSAGRIGFRVDGQPDEKDVWMVQGDLYKSRRQDYDAYAIVAPVAVEVLQGQTDNEGGYLQARWTHTHSVGNESTFQFSYSRDHYSYPFAQPLTNNLTVDFQNRRQTGARNEVYWGAGYQQYWDTAITNRYVSFDPVSSVYTAGDAVIRDEYQFVPSRLVGSAGIRIDYTSYGHLEYQPSLRLLYTPNKRQSAWVSASRALRLPSRFDRDLQFDGGQFLAGGFPIALTSVGSKQMSSEVERSLEAGYRFQAGQRWSIDASIFLSYYSRLFGVESPTMPVVTFSGATPILSLPGVIGNPGAGRTRGGEIWGNWQVRNGWRLIPSYSWIDESWRLPPNTAVSYGWELAPSSSPHQAQVRSQHDLSRNWKLDLMARFRSRNDVFDLPAALLVDTRLSWKTSRATELSLSLKNLTNRHVLESYPEGPITAIPTRRTFVLNWIYRL